ncbi:unnamed protein product [Tetraodon nigroviridis]|uniref:(spotted green pufferfish) hypothetical protein n=1 Tax=Tetraodon nigroviridis TaxID=99883 RepID=Q4SMW6_TETNG|nr:unnamed protein product [Tetraodon nigroviridis]
MKHQLLVVLLCASCGASALGTSIPAVPTLNFTGLGEAQSHGTDPTAKIRKRRYISQNDMLAILDYHNKVRGRVFPPASNMEYMVWGDTFARTAEDWAHACMWEHGPPHLLRFLGQNLSVRTGRYRSILQLVKPWYDEVKDYAFPYPRDCNPRCPLKCYGPMCTHYTQVPPKQPRCGLGTLPAPLTRICVGCPLSDGVGLIQQSGLCRPHLPQHERVGFSVETGDVLSLQLLAKGQLDRRGPLQSRRSLLGLPSQLRRLLQQQHVLPRSQDKLPALVQINSLFFFPSPLFLPCDSN